MVKVEMMMAGLELKELQSVAQMEMDEQEVMRA